MQASELKCPVLKAAKITFFTKYKLGKSTLGIHYSMMIPFVSSYFIDSFLITKLYKKGKFFYKIDLQNYFQ